MSNGEGGDRSLLGRALVALVRRPEVRSEDPAGLLEELPTAELVELACQHRVPGVVYRALDELHIDDAAYRGLRPVHQMAVVGHSRCLSELEGMTDALDALATPWMVVKGPVLVEVGYRDAGARLYEDLDLVVAPSETGRALALLEAAGGHVTDLNWPLMTRQRRAELPVVLPRGMLGDLHWHLLVTPGIRARFALPMAELVERRRVVRLAGTDVATLDPTDGLLYLCLHGSLSGGHQLVWLTDIDRMIAAEPPQWDVLIRRARRYRVDLVAALQLERSRSVLGAAVPAGVVSALAGGRSWWRWWSRQEHRVGMARWGGEDRTGRTYVAATSSGTGASLLQLGRSVALDVMAPSVARRSPSRDAHEAPPLYRAVGGEERRAEYFDRVAADGWG